MYVSSKSAFTGIVIYSQSICDAIIRAQDVMHSGPKLVVRVNKRKEFEYGGERLHGKKSSKRGAIRVAQSPRLIKSVNKFCVGHIYPWLRRPLSIAALIEAFRDARFTPKCSSSLRRISRFVIELRSAARKIVCTARSISASDGPGELNSPAASDRVAGIATSR